MRHKAPLEQRLLLQLLRFLLLLLLGALQLQNLVHTHLSHGHLVRDREVHLAEQNHVFASDHVDTARDVAVLGADMNALDAAREQQVGVLVNAAQVADQGASVAENDH